MAGQQLLRLEDELVDEVGSLLRRHPAFLNGSICFCLHQQGLPRFVRMVVGRGADDVFRAALDNQQVAVLYAGNEFHALATLPCIDGRSQFAVEIFDEQRGVLGFQVPSVVGDNLSVFDGNDVAAYGHIVVGHLVTNGGGFQGAAAFIYLVQVVTQDGGVGYFAAGRESLGNRYQASGAALASKAVHVFRPGVLKQGLVAKTGHLVVGHPVAQNNKVLHDFR